MPTLPKKGEMPNGVKAVGQGGLRVAPTFEQAAKVPPARIKPQETHNLVRSTRSVNFFGSKNRPAGEK